MKIAILGTRGIPNRYGGFEQFSEYVSVGLSEKGHDVTVYNPHFHKSMGLDFNGVHICHKYCPEDKLGSLAHFIYDYLCLRDALKKDFDIILECGYGTSSVSYLVLPTYKSCIVTNMDGIEWKRSKYSGRVKKLMKWFEKIAAYKSDYLIADNHWIQHLLKLKYGVQSTMIPYGATVVKEPQAGYLKKYDVTEQNYYILIARLEPANNIEMILEGYDRSNSSKPFIVIGNDKTEYGEYYKNKFKHNSNIRFLGSIYDQKVINNLRYFSFAYLHGHTVGGTNPSLLEAMACSCVVIANDNIFNRSILRTGGLYFKDAEDIAELLGDYSGLMQKREQFIETSLKQIKDSYQWDIIIDKYEELFLRIMNLDKDKVNDVKQVQLTESVLD